VPSQPNRLEINWLSALGTKSNTENNFHLTNLDPIPGSSLNGDPTTPNCIMTSPGDLGSVSVANGGTGYVVGNTVSLTGSGVGSGTGAVVTVRTVAAGGVVTGVNITAAGSGYPSTGTASTAPVAPHAGVGTGLTLNFIAAVLPDPPHAGFNTYYGTGHGTLNGLPASIRFKFTDFGEPGTLDTANYIIYNSIGGTVANPVFSDSGTVVLNTMGDLPISKGNQQAH
jgi:hypothetical protein